MRVLLIKTGTTVPNVKAERGDFERWFAAGMGLPLEALEVIEVHAGVALPEQHDAQAIVVTGSAALVTDLEPWSERTAAWLREAMSEKTPTLGVCYGHQLLAHALGGRVDKNPHGRNIGTIDVTLTEHGLRDPLFRDLPSTLHVAVSHVQSVISTPPGARIVATSERDPHHAFTFDEHVWAVQFHPEFDAQIVRGYIAARRDTINSEGLDADAIASAALDTAHGAILLRNFVAEAHRLNAKLRSNS